MDQNEKLVMFGCTHAGAVDGYSEMIVGFYDNANNKQHVDIIMKVCSRIAFSVRNYNYCAVPKVIYMHVHCRSCLHTSSLYRRMMVLE